MDGKISDIMMILFQGKSVEVFVVRHEKKVDIFKATI